MPVQCDDGNLAYLACAVCRRETVMITAAVPTNGRHDQSFLPAWPRLPWRAFSGQYRLPMRDIDLEAAAVRIEDLWCLTGLPDGDRRLLLKAARDLEHLNCGYKPTSGEDIFYICALLGELEGRHRAPN